MLVAKDQLLNVLTITTILILKQIHYKLELKVVYTIIKMIKKLNHTLSYQLHLYLFQIELR